MRGLRAGAIVVLCLSIAVLMAWFAAVCCGLGFALIDHSGSRQSLLFTKTRLTSLQLIDVMGQPRNRLNSWAIDQLIAKGYDPLALDALRRLAENGDHWQKSGANIVLFRMRDKPDERLETLLSMMTLVESEEFFIRFTSEFQPQDSEYAPTVYSAYLSSPEAHLRLPPVLFKMWRSSLVRNHFVLDPLASKSAEDRAMAARMIALAPEVDSAMVGDSSLVDAALSLVDDPNDQVRTEAVKALRYHGRRTDSIEALAAVLRHDRSPSVRLEALRSLRALAPSDFVADLAAELGTDSSDQVKSEARSVLIRARCRTSARLFGVPALALLTATVALLFLKRNAISQTIISTVHH